MTCLVNILKNSSDSHKNRYLTDNVELLAEYMIITKSSDAPSREVVKRLISVFKSDKLTPEIRQLFIKRLSDDKDDTSTLRSFRTPEVRMATPSNREDSGTDSEDEQISFKRGRQVQVTNHEKEDLYAAVRTVVKNEVSSSSSDTTESDDECFRRVGKYLHKLKSSHIAVLVLYHCEPEIMREEQGRAAQAFVGYIESRHKRSTS